MKTNRILLVAALGSVLLGGCSRDDGFTGGGTGEAVGFTAGIQATRTTGGGDAWAAGDAVGIHMLANGGNITATADVLADNVRYNVTDTATGELSPASTPIYYPQSGTVDFIAYYPYGTVTAGVYDISVADQTDPAAIDVLYAKTTGMSKSNSAVGLTFGHVLSKATLNVKAGTGFEAADISGIADSAVVFGGMPATARLALQDGALTAGTDLAQTFNPLKNATPPSGYDASFTALLVPQAADAYAGRTVTFTVGDQPYTWTIPDTEPFAAGSHYTYPVTVNKTGVAVGDPEITDWTTNDNGAGEVEQVRIVPEANSYMVEPDGVPILIPVSQANRVLTADGLGAETTGLGGVTANNFTVELVWGDLPIGAGGVIKEIRANGEYVYVKPGVEGNAVICIKVGGVIIWSWHIWVTEQVTSKTDSVTGLTWMDRNLGAKSDTPLVNGSFDQVQWVKTLGLFYQWGRKDASPGSDGTPVGDQSYSQTYYIGDSTTGTKADPPTGSDYDLPYMVQNPLTFVTNSSEYLGSLNAVGDINDSWGGVSGKKTLYDPCPPGWKVPPIEVNGTNSWGSSTTEDTDEWTFRDYLGTYKGAIFNGVNGTAALNHFYPAPGYRENSQGTLYVAGSTGDYWSSTPSLYNLGYSMSIYSSRANTAYDGSNRSEGFSVRCVAE